MTAGEYLKARGWRDDEDGTWLDPFGNYFDSDRALNVQRARDHAEERVAWAAWFGECIALTALYVKGSAEIADAMLVEYRARFAVVVEP